MIKTAVFLFVLIHFGLCGGIDFTQQLQNLYAALEGLRVGILTNPTGVDDQLNLVADDLFKNPNIQLKCFFAPEHGLRGDQQDQTEVKDYIDPQTNLPVYSLFGTRLRPTDEQLADIDVLVYYIQDVGVRFYTYIWTMTYAMEACADNNKKFIVFDRPNPQNANRVEGCPNIFNSDILGRLFPGQTFGLPLKYGMTIGEFATLVNNEWLATKVELQVIQMIGYYRDMYFEDTGLTWVQPSPNMPTLDTVTVYPGTCLIEGSNISEGRGTTRPFEMIGATYIDSYKLADKLQSLPYKNVIFRPNYYIPTFDKYINEICGGVQVHCLDRNNYDSVSVGMSIVQNIFVMYPLNVTFTETMNQLFGLPDFTTKIKTEKVDDILLSCAPNLMNFIIMRNKYLFYTNRPQSAGDNN